MCSKKIIKRLLKEILTPPSTSTRSANITKAWLSITEPHLHQTRWTTSSKTTSTWKRMFRSCKKSTIWGRNYMQLTWISVLLPTQTCPIHKTSFSKLQRPKRSLNFSKIAFRSLNNLLKCLKEKTKCSQCEDHKDFHQLITKMTRMTSTMTISINSNNQTEWMKSLTNNLMKTISETTVMDRVISLTSERMMLVELLESLSR